MIKRTQITGIIRMTLCLLVVGSLTTSVLQAQYFGQNKPRYRTFDFEIQQSKHYNIYHYLPNKKVLDDIQRKSEQWYHMHAAVLNDSLRFKNPIVLYNNHPDFQQTNTISSAIGVGTGGVTESLKNRVVFPLTFTNEQTNHVLGHELVHAFQYNMILNGDSTNIQNMRNIPLWMVEGMAEYLSKGSVDPFTAMWMRSSVLNDDIPTFNDLRNHKYFPYRYGQAFWAYVCAQYGDQIMRPLFEATAKYGLENAVGAVLGISLKNLEKAWAEQMKTRYEAYMVDKDVDEGKTILDEKSSGMMNVSPSMSPNGKYITFWSEKEVLGTSLYMADARTGKVIRKLTSDKGNGHLDAINFLEASGTWSRDSKKFAFVGVDKGRNVILILDVKTGKIIDKIALKQVPAFTNLAWNPAGKSIVLTGLVNGQVDLYEVKLKSKKVEQLTNNPYSEIAANFNKDGSKLTYATDYKSVRFGRKYGHYSFDIAVMDMESKEVEVLDIFPGANNLNPNFDHEGNILFLSNRDGFRNIYKINLTTDKLEQLTDLKTGVSGITDLAPALSVSTRRDRMVYSIFNDFKYYINNNNYSKMKAVEVDRNAVDFDPGTLVAPNPEQPSAVNKNIKNQDKILNSLSDIALVKKPYRPNFKLDFIGGGAGIGVGNNTFGNNTALAGGIQMLFSDQLGKHQIFANLALNGELFDAGGQVSYINRSNRIAYGIGISHIPLRTGYAEPVQYVDLKNSAGQVFPGAIQNLNIIRVFNDGINLFAHLPFSQYLRLEGGIAGSYQTFRWDKYKNTYIREYGQYRQIRKERDKVPTPDELQFNQYYTVEKGFQATLNVALVGDNSVFGMTSPLKGHRFRLSVEQHIGINKYTAFLADGRKYFWMKPFSFALRGMAYNRLDQAKDNNVYPFYIGQQTFVRGYGSAFSNYQKVITRLNKNNINFGQLIGSNMALASAEVRLPFTGPKRLALIPFTMLMSDLCLFFDTGVAYNKFSDFNAQVKPYVTMSAGASIRVNVFNALIIEPYYAYLFKEKQFAFGFNLAPGW